MLDPWLVGDLPWNLLFSAEPTHLIEGVHCGNGRSCWIYAPKEFSQEKRVGMLTPEALTPKANCGLTQLFAEEMAEVIEYCLVEGAVWCECAD